MELKPCPFCGGEVFLWEKTEGKVGRIIECRGCDLRAAFTAAYIDEQVIGRWNGRVENGN